MRSSSHTNSGPTDQVCCWKEAGRARFVSRGENCSLLRGDGAVRHCLPRLGLRSTNVPLIPHRVIVVDYRSVQNYAARVGMLVNAAYFGTRYPIVSSLLTEIRLFLQKYRELFVTKDLSLSLYLSLQRLFKVYLLNSWNTHGAEVSHLRVMRWTCSPLPRPRPSSP